MFDIFDTADGCIHFIGAHHHRQFAFVCREEHHGDLVGLVEHMFKEEAKADSRHLTFYATASKCVADVNEVIEGKFIGHQRWSDIGIIRKEIAKFPEIIAPGGRTVIA